MSREQSEEYEDDKVVETGPNGTYVRFDHKLGSGAFKTVYRALDTERGIEVAWNQVLLDRFQLDLEKVLREIEFFKKIRHKHVIEFYNFWTNERKNQVVFITELMPSGTLTNYIEKSPEVKLKIIKSWCKQILLGLNYLHTQNPPIIHRDIKCGNIFINGQLGEVKIGDLGLATFSLQKDALSVIGTPEFMAPEYYNEVYSTGVDIWAFGMAMIEMVTLQYPYAECDNVAQIFKKVSGGVLPQQLELILDTEVRNFIELCLADEQERPTAAQLLEHPFFDIGENDNNPVKIAGPNQVPPTTPTRLDSPDREVPSVGVSIHHKKQTETNNKPRISSDGFKMQVVRRIGDVLEIEANMIDNTKEASKIEFSYNLATDDPATTAFEMVRSLELDPSSHQLIASAFVELVENHPLRMQTMTELSELVSCNDDSDSAHSEPTPVTQTIFPVAAVPAKILSDPENDYHDFSDLELLIEEGEYSNNLVQDNTDLEDLLDENDLLDDDELSEHSLGGRSFGSKSHLADDDSLLGTSSSGNPSDEEDDDEEILALKAKHAQDMRKLLKSQQDELLAAEQDIFRKKLSKNMKFNRSANNLKDYQASRTPEDYRVHSTLCT